MRGAAALAVLLGAACLTPTQRREETLVREARMFNDDLRWGRYEQLTASLPREEAQALLARVDAVAEDLVMADYEVTSITFHTGSEAATSMVKLDWYTRARPTLRSTTLEQRWEYKNGKWVCVKQRRVRGDRFPLVIEPLPDPAAEAAPAGAAPAEAAP